MRYSLLSLVILLASLGFVPVNAASASPSNPDPTHPYVMQEAGAEVATAPVTAAGLSAAAAPASARQGAILTGPFGPQREVFGFALSSSLSDPTVGYPSWNFSLLTTVAFFGLHVQDDGTLASDSGAAVWNSGALTAFVSAAHAHATKVVVTIILQDFAAGTPHMCSALNHYPATVASTVAEMRAKGVDGVNLDYEGLNGSCGTPDSTWARDMFTFFVSQLRAALGSGPYLTVDTYASSAADPIGFFDVAHLAGFVDAFFVMAYDLEYSNYLRAPTSCSSFCLGPTAPLTGYYYNDTSTASEYASVVPASQVILGVPYYGRKACVAGTTPNQYPASSIVADMYVDATGEAGAPMVQPGTYAAHRDANDPAGQERWDTWVNTSLNCTRELYWDDTVSLGLKYDLVNRDNLRGVGIWNLNYGGGAPELWNLLASKFATTSAWASLSGVLTSGPDASSWGAARIDVFAAGTDRGLWQNTWNGTAWNGWSSLGGIITADPSAVSWSPGRIDVVARGSDNAIWHRYTGDGSHWSGWESLGGRFISGPDIASWSAGRLDIFGIGTDRGLWHKYWGSTGWSGWEPLGGVLTSDPAAVSWSGGRVDIFARGTDYAMWHKYWTGTGWSGWESLGGGLISGPDAASCSPGHLDLYAVAGDYGLYRESWNGTQWSGWQRLGGAWTSDPGAVCVPGSAAVTLFARGTDSAIWTTSVPGS